jgi:alpha-beta hydrolase superfamily lysophospholipase
MRSPNLFTSLEQLTDLTKQVRLALADSRNCARKAASQNQEHPVAKKAKKRTVRRYTKAEEKELRAHSKAKTPVAKISKLTKRSVAALRKKAGEMGFPLGHRR